VGAVLAGALLLAGCATARVNGKLQTFDGTSGYRYGTLATDGNGDDLFVILAFSGGGTRAAAFSFGVMEALRDARHTNDRPLLDDVDVISSVSGGSFTAAYYALFRDRMFTEQGRETYLHEKIHPQDPLVRRALSPASWFKLLSRDYDRINLAADLYDETIFEGQTFGALMGRKPYLILNATDMSLGQRFEFTQDQFDLLCSDLASVKIASGVAASSAFPGLLSPLTLESFAAEGCGYREPRWLTNAKSPNNPARRWKRGLDSASYQDEKADRRFVHLLDGGLADNIGLRGPYVALTSNDSGWSVIQKINLGAIKRVVVVTANAKTKHKTAWDQRRDAPGLLSVLGFVTSGPMDNYSFDSVQLVTDYFDRIRESFQNFTACKTLLDTRCPGTPLPGTPTLVDFHAIEISFEGFRGADDRVRRCLEELPTTFKLSRDQVELLRRAAYVLVTRSASFNATMKAIDARWMPRDVTIEPALIARACATTSGTR
jgi:predicted acylesterase/phospholipase RssA